MRPAVRAYFPMQARSMTPLFAPKLIVTDWDETATEHDTIALVAEAAYLAKPNFTPKFTHFSQVYMDAYEKYCREFGRSRNDLVTEIEFQTGLRAVELASINEMQRLQLFKDVPVEVFQQQAQKVTLRPGFLEFLKRSIKNEVPVVILSINWSQVFIEAALAHHGVDPSNVTVLVNNLEVDLGRTTGRFAAGSAPESGQFGSVATKDLSRFGPRTGPDKLAVVQRLTEEYGEDIMYVGDSSTDLLSLLEVPFGVAMDGGSVLNTLERLLLPFTDLSGATAVDTGTLYVGNWTDLNHKIWG